MTRLDGAELQGRALMVNEAKPQRERSNGRPRLLGVRGGARPGAGVSAAGNPPNTVMRGAVRSSSPSELKKPRLSNKRGEAVCLFLEGLWRLPTRSSASSPAQQKGSPCE